MLEFNQQEVFMRSFIIAFMLTITAFSYGQQTDIIFFSDSPDGDDFYDSSWGFETSPSFLELWVDKFPVDVEHPYQGAHSLRLHWISVSGGDWGIAVASPGWPPHDLTQYDSIVYWINSPDSISPADLPDLAIEDINNNKSSRVWLGDYFNGVDADSTTWQKVSVPIADIQPGPQNADFTKIKTIFHYQKAADGNEHVAWIDEIRAIQKGGGGGGGEVEAPRNLTAKGYDSRIDLKWKANTEESLAGYYIYRSDSPAGPFEKLNPVVHAVHLFSDFLGQNNLTHYYYVTAVTQNYDESLPSDTVFATSAAMTEEELLVSVQEAAFHYFYEFGHPVSGLARERNTSEDVCTSGGTGFGLLNIMIGAERGFITRDSAAARILKILTFLQDVTPRYHGAWSHWINGRTGETIPFSQYDDGGDLVETAYLIQGILTIRQYFNQSNPVENEIRTRATQMWEDVEWDWYRKDPPENKLYWHWSPNFNWTINMPIQGWNETMIVYLLAIASPTHPVPASLYYSGWAGSPNYANGNTYYGYTQWVGKPYGGPLFFTHYSFLGFDPRDKADQYCNYFENNRNISLINRAYCIDNPLNQVGYDSLVWGLTASDDPWGYLAHEPYNADNGTITPTAAISAMPYTPEESKATLSYFYYQLGPQLWGEFGFRDAFNPGANWFAQSTLAIDQGTMAPMIENHLSGLCWEMFMSNPEITQMLNDIGWVVGIDEANPNVPQKFDLLQNYPNPFNSETVVTFSLPKSSKVSIAVFNVLGEKVADIVPDQLYSAGEHRVKFSAENLASGLYLYKMTTSEYHEVKKMLLIR